jgi:hypothetical protein
MVEEFKIHLICKKSFYSCRHSIFKALAVALLFWIGNIFFVILGGVLSSFAPEKMVNFTKTIIAFFGFGFIFGLSVVILIKPEGPELLKRLGILAISSVVIFFIMLILLLPIVYFFNLITTPERLMTFVILLFVILYILYGIFLAFPYNLLYGKFQLYEILKKSLLIMVKNTVRQMLVYIIMTFTIFGCTLH